MANDLSGFLAVYSQESLQQLIANAPMFGSFTTDFSGDIGNGGTSVTTRIPTTTYTANDTAANGFVAVAASSSAVTVTLKQRDITHQFTELEWSTYNPQTLARTFIGPMVQSLANSIVVDAMSLISTGSYTTKWISSTANSLSASAVFRVAELLSTNAVPYADRTLIVKPTYYEGIVNSVYPQYTVGTVDMIQNYRATKVGGFSVQEFAAVPTVDGGLVGFGAHKSGIAVAMRAPAEINNNVVQSQTVTDPSSGLSIQTRIVYDTDGYWKLAVTSVYGVAVGNTKAIVPILSA